MKTKNILSLLLITGVFFLILSCSSLPTKTEEVKSGRLQYIETLKYGPAGTHGSDGWYVNDREFNVNGSNWHPPAEVKMNDISGCSASPNTGVEVLKCTGYDVQSNEIVCILRLKADKPEWVTVLSKPFSPDRSDMGEWVSDGHWLIFKDSYFNVETSERKEIKGLPAYPGDNLMAISPDMETIIYKESCLPQTYDEETHKPLNEPEHDKQCRLYDDHIKNNILVFWLIDAATGQLKTLELKREKYPWIVKEEGVYPVDWIKTISDKLVWEKDKNGKYQLTYPT